MNDLAFSLNEEYYYDDIDYILDEIEDDTVCVYVGVKVEQKHSHFFNVNSIIEEAQERSYDVGEFAEGYLDDITKEQKRGIAKSNLRIPR